jgi:hypothetical protein
MINPYPHTSATVHERAPERDAAAAELQIAAHHLTYMPLTGTARITAAHRLCAQARAARVWTLLTLSAPEGRSNWETTP